METGRGQSRDPRAGWVGRNLKDHLLPETPSSTPGCPQPGLGHSRDGHCPATPPKWLQAGSLSRCPFCPLSKERISSPCQDSPGAPKQKLLFLLTLHSPEIPQHKHGSVSWGKGFDGFLFSISYSQNHCGWKRSPRPWSPTFDRAFCSEEAVQRQILQSAGSVCGGEGLKGICVHVFPCPWHWLDWEVVRDRKANKS